MLLSILKIPQVTKLQSRSVSLLYIPTSLCSNRLFLQPPLPLHIQEGYSTELIGESQLLKKTADAILAYAVNVVNSSTNSGVVESNYEPVLKEKERGWGGGVQKRVPLNHSQPEKCLSETKRRKTSPKGVWSEERI